MSTNSNPDSAALERLSALTDGELNGPMTAHACNLWREAPQARRTWYAYHLIGDVLRSDDLACDPSADADFLATFRTRLQVEPVVFAPELPQPLQPAVPVSESALGMAQGKGRWQHKGRSPGLPHVVNGLSSRRWSWMVPSAVAAGCVAVASVVVIARPFGTPPSALAGADSPGIIAPLNRSTGPAPAATVPSAAYSEPEVAVFDGRLIRDARLDRYLVAHKQFAGSSALGVPSTFLRNATAVETDR